MIDEGNSYGYDTGASGLSQENLNAVETKIKTLISTRTSDASRLAGEAKVTDVSEQYQQVEDLWARAGDQFAGIVRDMRTLLSQADDTAGTTVKKAGGTVQNI